MGLSTNFAHSFHEELLRAPSSPLVVSCGVLSQALQLTAAEPATTPDQQPRSLDLGIAGIDTLQLIVENAGNGNAADWGVWLEPTLRR